LNEPSIAEDNLGWRCSRMDHARLKEVLGSPEAFEALADEERWSCVSALVDRLGPGWSCHGAVLRHERAPGDFVVIAGGSLTMGIGDTDFAQIGRWVDIESVAYSLEEDGRAASPVHRVQIHPFVCARLPLAEGTMARERALEQASAYGLRLPSEAELEWIHRDGGRCALVLGARPVQGRPGAFTFKRSRFGVEGFFIAQWAADDWHPSYEGAPATSEPWMEGDAAGVCRCTFSLPAMVAEEDIATLAAGIRTRGSIQMPAVARLALPIPL
jgi:hypothetical protein